MKKLNDIKDKKMALEARIDRLEDMRRHAYDKGMSDSLVMSFDIDIALANEQTKVLDWILE